MCWADARMEIVHDGHQLDRYLARLTGDLDRPSELVVSKKRPLLIDRYLVGCHRGRCRLPRRRQGHLHRRHHGAYRGSGRAFRRQRLRLPPHSLDADTDRRTRAPDPRPGAGAEGRRPDERAIRHQGRRHLRAGGQSARLAHRALRRQGDRPAGREDRQRASWRARSLSSFNLKPPSSEHIGGQGSGASRSRASPAWTPCWGPEMQSDRRGDGPRREFRAAPSPRARSAPARGCRGPAPCSSR